MMWGAMKGIRIAQVGLVAATLTGAALTTAAQAQEGELVKGFLGAIGVISGDKPAIDYRERPPLVLPPRMELREPVQPGSVQARNQQWPNDPDAAARKRQAAEERMPVTETELGRINRENTRLTVDEMRANRRAGAEVPNGPVSRAPDNAWVHPDVLRAQDRQGRSTQVATGDNGKRRSLTDPPSAYRQSATGQPIRGSFEVPNKEDIADPKLFHRQQQRNQ